MSLVHLQVRNPKDDETPIESATQIFSSILPHANIPLWKTLFTKSVPFAFEIYLINQTIYFYVTASDKYETFIISLITSAYPKCQILKTEDPMKTIVGAKQIATGEMKLSSYYIYPIKTYMDFQDVDPLSSLVGFLSKQGPEVVMAIQIITQPASFPWQNRAVQFANTETLDSASGNYAKNPQKEIVIRKASFQGGKATIRIVAATNDVNPDIYLHNLAGTFGSFSLGEGNQFKFKRPLLLKKKFLQKLEARSFPYLENKNQIFNAQELATIWHPPGFLLAGIKNIAWGKNLAGEPPENLPIAQTASEEEKKDTNYFAKTEFKNQEAIFGIKTTDRRRHVYIIGKTGTGKSTLIANMAIDDIRKDRGVGIIDPHGDLSETILDYIPKRRVNDVVYLEPFDKERVFSLNLFETKNKSHRDLIASGIVSIFYKLYKDSWGPRLEYILRNVILTLLEIEDSTLLDVLRLIADRGYRNKIVQNIQDPVIKNFWEREFERMPDNLKAEAVSPIQNKVGQFVSSKMIRNIVGYPRSTVDFEQIMNEGKILILNLSQGKLGEDNAALLGAMVITQIQLAAMNRSFIAESQRKDFFLYVDEFQNFATNSFIKILSEARKYRLSLTLANQYIDQLDEGVQKAIFGNAGTLVSFVVGAGDALLLTKEFGEIYTENDLVALGRFETVVKLSIDGMTSGPFPANTLPLPSLKNENKETIVRLSSEKYGRKVGEQRVAPPAQPSTTVSAATIFSQEELPQPTTPIDLPPTTQTSPNQTDPRQQTGFSPNPNRNRRRRHRGNRPPHPNQQNTQTQRPPEPKPTSS